MELSRLTKASGTGVFFTAAARATKAREIKADDFIVGIDDSMWILFKKLDTS